MNVEDMLSELDDHGFADTGIPRQLAMLQDTVWEVDSLEPWPFLEASASLDTNGTATPTQPSNLRAILSIKDTITGRRLRPLRLDDFDEFVGLNTAQVGDPQFYYQVAETINIWPLPATATGRLLIRYLQKSPVITEDTVESDFLLPREEQRIYVLGALIRLYTMEDDPELALAFSGQYADRLNKMREKLWQRQFDTPDYIHMTDPGDGDWLHV